MPEGVWQLGLALGLCIDAGLLLAAAVAGWRFETRWLGIGAPILVICASGMPFLVAVFQGAVACVVRLDRWRHRNDAPPPVTVLAPVVEKDTDYDAEREAWRVALDRFFRAGEAAGGFSAGKLSGVAGSDAWPRLVHFYSSETGGNVLRDAGGNTGHTWGHGWTLDRVMLALHNNNFPLPDMPVPVIQPYVAAAPQRRASRKSAAVVDGTARAAD